jgi:predicted regulator of Ras-like GTPase activity (Roadblock/LC7/MglB family)
MRSEELPAIVGAVRGPMHGFVREARVRLALLVNHSGQVLAQHGFASSYEVVNVASLAAAAHASSRVLAEISGAGRWTHLYHAGRERQLFLAPVKTPVEELIVVTIFDTGSTLGLVQVFFDRLAAELVALPIFGADLGSTDQVRFESDLEAGIQRVFESDAD